MVRFLDNFSIGTRGAASAEYFIAHGYAVIFLFRKRSRMPFHRHYQENPRSNFLDDLVIENGRVVVNPQQNEAIKKAIEDLQAARKGNMLLEVEFQTIHEYLFWLQKIVESLAPLKKRALFFSAAAVSDFYLKHTAENKIQSSNGPLNLELAVVPKVIPTLKSQWLPQGMIVTFKLETTDSILGKKVNVHLVNYNVDLVIGNILGKHRDQVVICQKGQEDLWLKRSEKDIAAGIELEESLVATVVKRHEDFIKS